MPDAAGIDADLIALARGIARGWGRAYPHLAAEFESDALLAVVEAARAHDPARGAFGGLVRVVVARALGRRLAAERVRAGVWGQYTPRDGGEVHPADLLADPGPAPDARAERADDAADLARRLARLPPRHRDVLVRYVGNGEAVADLAAEMGVSPERVRQLVSAAVRRAGGPG